MQKPITNLPIKSFCSTTDGANAVTPVVIVSNFYSDTLDNGNTKRWYRKYSDGHIEQGGYGTNLVIDSVVRCNYVVPYTDSSTISVFITPHSTGAGSSPSGAIQVADTTTTDFGVHYDAQSIANIDGYYWEATGI